MIFHFLMKAVIWVLAKIALIIGGIVLTYFGYIALKHEWKIRYLFPISFFGFFAIFFLINLILFKHDNDHLQLFIDGHLMLNDYAENVFLASGMFSGLISFFLTLSIWAVRNGESIDLL